MGDLLAVYTDTVTSSVAPWLRRGPGPVGVGQLPALVDEVVSEAEEERTVQAPGGNAAHAGLYLDGGHGLGQQRRNLGLDCLSAQPTCEGFEM